MTFHRRRPLYDPDISSPNGAEAGTGTRQLLSGILATAALAVACGDSFRPEDALGIWDLERFNGAPVPGDVWIREPSGDSLLVGFEEFHLEFLTAPGCLIGITFEGGPPQETNDCSYAVTEDGDFNLVVAGDFTMSGTAEGDELTLTDEDTNVLDLRRRT